MKFIWADRTGPFTIYSTALYFLKFGIEFKLSFIKITGRAITEDDEALFLLSPRCASGFLASNLLSYHESPIILYMVRARRATMASAG